jgi:hypothetical protein
MIGAATLVACASCASQDVSPIAVGDRVTIGDRSVSVDVRVAREHRASATRYLAAATAALTTLETMLGPYPESAITLVDASIAGGSRGDAAAVVIDPTPWWSTAAAMTPEIATARGVARRYWTKAVDTRALPSWFVDALVGFSARRIVMPMFQRIYVGDGYAMLEQRFFGGFVPWFVRVRLHDTDGDAVTAYRRQPRVDAAADAAADHRALVGKTMLTLSTLERWLSAPALDGAFAAFVRASAGRQPTLREFADTISAASGQDLSWLFDQTFGTAATFDYAVVSLTTTASARGYLTTVVVQRRGDGVFSGTAAPRVGAFESGRGITVRVRFASDEAIDDTWDGRDVTRRFTYDSRSPAVSAVLDPDRILMLDLDETNNSRTLTPRSGSAATRWAARWVQWFESVLLTWAFFA